MAFELKDEYALIVVIASVLTILFIMGRLLMGTALEGLVGGKDHPNNLRFLSDQSQPGLSGFRGRRMGFSGNEPPVFWAAGDAADIYSQQQSAISQESVGVPYGQMPPPPPPLAAAPPPPPPPRSGFKPDKISDDALLLSAQGLA